MNRHRFIEVAPVYYGLAIATFFQNTNSLDFAYKNTFAEYYVTDPDRGRIEHLHNDILFKVGADYAAKEGLIEVINDDFGPVIYKASEKLGENWQRLATDKSLPFFKYDSVGNGGFRWLTAALDNVNDRYSELGIGAEDFDGLNTEWEPIPLERHDQDLAQAIARIDDVIQSVRSENGYSASFLEERNYVLDKLQSVSKRLKEDFQISYIYLREFALEPLIILVRRFHEAAIGVAATAAKEAIKEWLKRKGINFLDGVL